MPLQGEIRDAGVSWLARNAIDGAARERTPCYASAQGKRLAARSRAGIFKSCCGVTDAAKGNARYTNATTLA